MKLATTTFTPNFIIFFCIFSVNKETDTGGISMFVFPRYYSYIFLNVHLCLPQLLSACTQHTSLYSQHIPSGR